MTASALLLLTGYAFISIATPGPNNLMLMASGANFGCRRTVAHMLGISIGMVSMLLLTGFGISQLFAAVPASYDILRVLSVSYMLYLAYKILNIGSFDADNRNNQPMSIIQAAAFQWVNPKAWAMALTAISVYLPNTELSSIVIAAIVFGLVCLPSNLAWTLLGEKIKQLLSSIHRRRLFNYTMAGLLLLSLYPILFSQ
ncbi:threonine/homoserine/homoserine lactone efflux protein [Sinobacterium caligoides]|uniref:Threonine/homoserine/homoserine lactone efflux protein n=1 Tax=Sinobacterium caligoides TaxID=933926 RepID=A0A3N2E041_9GAMM|nr:LysE family translocator [Sinobacterium caligoides]ROS05448.1 threonine/homoserine/homoserine lactone efflux protein [Sinobacterium caligoides]